MLYWGIFTSGFIIGVIFSLFVVLRKEGKLEVSDSQIPENTPEILESTPDKIFDRLTKINYITGWTKGQNTSTVTKFSTNS